MAVRFPSVAGMFYPAGENACRGEVVECLESAQAPELAGPFRAGVVPHAGWSYSGPTAGCVFSVLDTQDPPETIVLFGAVHRWGVTGASMYGSGSWRTPLGDLSVDQELAQEVLRVAGSSVSDDPDAHGGEHSIEVQLPFVIHLFPGARILPIAVPPSPTAHQVGSQVAGAALALGRRTVAVGTTDLTHYGMGYGTPDRGPLSEAMDWMRDNDHRMIRAIESLDAEAIVPEAERHQNACGAGAVAAAVAAARALGAKSGRTLEYTTSADVMHEPHADRAVGYLGLVFER